MIYIVWSMLKTGMHSQLSQVRRVGRFNLDGGLFCLLDFFAGECLTRIFKRGKVFLWPVKLIVFHIPGGILGMLNISVITQLR